MTVVISSELVVSSQSQSSGGVTFNANNGIMGWINYVLPSNIQADSADPLFPIMQVANPSTYLYWLSTSMSMQRIIFTDNFENLLDYVGIAGHNFGSGACGVKIEVATDIDSSGDYDWTDVTSEVIPADDTPMMFRFTPAHYLAVSITLFPNDELPRIAVIYVGKLTIIERRMYVGHRIINYNTNANIVTGRSETGIFLGRINLGEFNETQIEFKNMTPQFYRSDLEPFRKEGIIRPFFFAWRPSSYPLEVGYCWAMSDMMVQNSVPNGFMTASLNVQGIVE